MNKLQSAEILPFPSLSGSVLASYHLNEEDPTFPVTARSGLAIDARLTEIQRGIAALLQREEEGQEYFKVPPLFTRRTRVRIRERREGTFRLVTSDTE